MKLAIFGSTWKNVCLLFFILCSICIPLGCLLAMALGNGFYGHHQEPQRAANYPVEYSSGIKITEVVPAPVYYETYIPVTFEHELPNYEKIIRDFVVSATSSMCSYLQRFSISGKPCNKEADPILKILDGFIRDGIFTESHTSSISGNVGHSQKTNYENSLEFCNAMEGHFKDRIISTKDYQEYRKQIENCRTDRFLSNFIFKNDYNTLKFDDLTSLPGNSMGDLSFLAKFLLNITEESNKWETRFQNCKVKGYNPFAFSSEQEQKLKALIAVENRLENNDIQKLSIPSYHFEKYDSLKESLTDCVFTDNNTFIERVLLPIIPLKANYLTFEVKAIPFNVIGLQSDQLCFIKDTDNKKFIYEEKSERFMKISDCSSQKLCKTPKLSEFENLEERDCISAIFFNDTERISKFCQFECQPNLKNDGFFKRVSSDTVALFSIPANLIQFFYKCDGDGENHAIWRNLADVASLTVTLPCNCRLYRDFDEVFRSVSPCDNDSLAEAKIVQIVPLNILRNNLRLEILDEQSQFGSRECQLQSDIMILIFIISALFLLFSISCQIFQIKKTIKMLKNWQENESEFRIQSFTQGDRNIIVRNVSAELIPDKN